MANTSKAKDKVENPEAHFAKPKQVVKDNVLSHDEKKKALNAWEQDERQLLTASNEGMSGSNEGLRVDDDNHLGDVVRAKGTIGKRRSTNHLIRHAGDTFAEDTPSVWGPRTGRERPKRPLR